MNTAAQTIVPDDDGPGLASWLVAALLVIALHAVIVYFVWHREEEAAPGAETPPAVMIELAPLAVAPPVEEQMDAPPAPTKTEEAPPEETQPPQPQMVEQPVVEQPPVLEPPPVVVPEAPLAPKPEVVLPMQKAAPPPPKPTPKVEKKVIKKEHKPVAERTAAPRHMDAAPSRSAAAPASEGTPSISSASWQAMVSARLNSVKRCPAGGSGSGTARVSFSISGGGGVSGARLAGSSGNAALDAEAVSMVHQAAPYPPTPTGGTVSLTVPIHFGC